jgi:hypothetical protein
MDPALLGATSPRATSALPPDSSTTFGARQVALGWALTLLASDLWNIGAKLTVGLEPEWLIAPKAAAPAIFLALSLPWPSLRPLRPYAVVVLAFVLAKSAAAWVAASPWWTGSVAGPGTTFTVGYLGFEALDLAVALVLVGCLLALGLRPSGFFLAAGRADAPIEPVRWLGIRRGESWSTFGWIFAACFGLGTLAFVVASGALSTAKLVAVAPLFPAVVLIAALNALNEELTYRAPQLATTHTVVGCNHAVWMAACLFGLAHVLHGNPGGAIGFVMTAFLGWVLGKSILETRGLLWAWGIHLVQGVVIFGSIALAWV